MYKKNNHTFTKSIFKIFFVRSFGKLYSLFALIFASPCCPSPAPASLAREHEKSWKNFFFILLFPFLSRRSRILLAILCVGGLLSSIEVEGHLTEDTIWSPANNPYIVVDNIFVDHNVTLTVLPGTIVKFNTSTYPNGDYNYGDGYSEAKFMKVSGKLKAEGTAQDSIIFTKNCEETDRRWGVIIFNYQSDHTSVLKHCVIEYTYQMSLFIGGDTYYGGISLSNAEITISNCYFKNFYFGIHCFYNSEPVIYNNYFTSDENNIEPGLGIYCCDNIGAKPFIFYNRFINSSGIGFHEVNISSYTPVAYNYFYNCNNGIHLRESPVYVFKNNFFGCSTAIKTMNLEAVIKQNYMDSCSGGIYAQYKIEAYENIITNGTLGITLSCNNSIIENNIISNNSNSGIHNLGNSSLIMNNLIINNGERGIYAVGGSVSTPYIINNIIAGSEKGLDISANCELFNNIFFDIEDYSVYTGNPNIVIHAGNNCFTAPIFSVFPSSFVDLGGNITDDPLLIDPLIGDYHLSELSPCIDTGTEDTTGLFLPMYDLDFLYRIWDGDNNGISIIDMGCYEFGSQPLIGGIEGYVTLNSNYNFLPFTEIDVNGTIAFPDTTGYYEMKLVPGIYDLHAYLEGYEEVIITDIEIIEGIFTEINFELEALVSEEDFQLPIFDFQLRNYPNPFNPETTIRFTTENTEKNTELIIYNIKGQKVKVFTFPNSDLSGGTSEYSVVWNGKDSNNKSVSSGIYLYKLKVDDYTSTKKMILLK